MKHETIYGKGKRQNNDDYLLPFEKKNNDVTYIVCDGVSSSKNSAKAALITANAIKSHLTETSHIDMKTIFDGIHKAEKLIDLYNLEKPSLDSIATTLAMLVLDKKKAIVSWVGDSRIYHFRNGNPLFISKDHTLANYIGENKKEYENILTKAISGTEKYAIPDFHLINDVLKGDYFLICTDGIHRSTNLCLGEVFSVKNDFKTIYNSLNNHCSTFSKDNYAAHLIKI
jgi:protein phosphatase